MVRRTRATIAATVAAYVVTTFAVQGTSHFVVNAEHYAAMAITRPEAIVPMGVLSMLIQGTIFAWLFPLLHRGGNVVTSALRFSWTMGAFLASYIVLGEAGKYAIPSIPAWILVELSAATVQYTIFGLLLGAIHRRAAVPSPLVAGA